MTDDELVADYLRRLRRAARVLPSAQRRELLEEIAEHIAQARESSAFEPGALRDVLEWLGYPQDIVAAAGGAAYTRGPGGRQISAVLLLLFGVIAGLVLAGFMGAIVGWGAGVVLLWISPGWRWPDRLLGTLAWPAGFAAMDLRFFLPPLLAILVIVAAFAVPFAVAVRLLRRVRDQDEPTASPLATR